MKTPFDRFLECDDVMQIFSPEEIPESVYHAEKRFLSKHALDVFADCPLKFKAWQDGKLQSEETPAMRFGSAFHAYALEPERFFRDYAILPPEIKVRRGKAWEEFEAKNAGREIITAEEFERIDAMHEALCENPKAVTLLTAKGYVEQTVLFRHAMFDGLPCKARIDRVLPEARILVDLKTCQSASPKAFASTVEKYRYDVQGAFYLDAINHTEPSERIAEKSWLFYIIAIEKEPPYAVAVYNLAQWLTLGAMTLERDLGAFLEAQKSGAWKGYEVPDDELPLTKWAQGNRSL